MKKLIYIFIFLSVLQSYNFLYSQVNQEWVVRYNGLANNTDRANSIKVDEDGNIYVTGSTAVSSNNWDYLTIKYNSAGAQQWIRTYNGPANHHDQAYDIAIDNASNVYVTGGSFGIGTERDFLTIKYNSNGDTLWTRRYNGPGNDLDEAVAVVLDSEGNVYVTGYSDSGNSLDYYTIKYNSAGEQQWASRYDGQAGPLGSEDRPHFLAVDKTGNVYVTGESSAGLVGIGLDMYATVKYDSFGDTVWTARYKGPGDQGLSQAYALAVDDNGNVYVTGRSDPFSQFGFNFDIVNIKYNSSGDALWVHRYNGPGNSSDIGNAIALDGAGNIVVTGLSVANTFSDIFTIKYSPSGDTLWTARYSGPDNRVDAANSIAIDEFDNIYVAGFSTGIGSLRDYITIKYNSSGVQQWFQKYNGPGNNDDEIRSMTIDAMGNVYVTGMSTGNGTGMDFATIKYSQEPIPVELISFTGFSEANRATLNWSTASETNNSGFDIEKCYTSTPLSVTEWEKVGFVEGYGTTTEQKFYSFVDKDLISGKYSFRLKQIDFDGTFEYSKVIEVDVLAPMEFSLEQNNPNPFNPATKITFTLPEALQVKLTVFNILGEEVKTLINENRDAGHHTINFDGSSFGSGVYLYKIQAGNFVQVRKMILTK